MALTKVTAAVLSDSAVSTDSIANDSIHTAKIADDAITTLKIADANITSSKIADDSISYNKLANEFTTVSALSASAVDFSSAQVFTKTLTANDTLTFSNVSTGMVKDLIITGNYTLTLPSSVKVISGEYDGTVSNFIQIVATNGSTEQWASISQQAV